MKFKYIPIALVASAFPAFLLGVAVSRTSFAYVGLIVGFTAVGLASVFAGFYLLCSFLDWRCQRCIDNEPGNSYCCE